MLNYHPGVRAQRGIGRTIVAVAIGAQLVFGTALRGAETRLGPREAKAIADRYVAGVGRLPDLRDGVQAEDRVAYAREANEQRKADEWWEPRLKRWKSWLVGGRANRSEAEERLAAVTDPRAVSSIWRVFASGRAGDQKLAVQLLGQVRNPSSSRRLALLAVSGFSGDVRSAAVETLRSRDPLEFADVLIGLLRDPIEYQARPVRGPGIPGSLMIKGDRVTVERIYAPSPPPSLGLLPSDRVEFDERGLPTLYRHTDETDLPFVWLYKGYIFSSGAVIPPHVPVVIPLGEMWVENWKAAHSAERQLRDDVTAIELENDLQRAANEQVADVLSGCIGQRLPADRTACRRWWFTRLGQTLPTWSEALRPTVMEVVPLDYLPRNVGGLGFDPVVGYYLVVPVNR